MQRGEWRRDMTSNGTGRSVFIFGGPGGGALAAMSLAALADAGEQVHVAGFLNDQLAPGTTVCGSPVHGPFESWISVPDDALFIAPLHSVSSMHERRARIEGLGVPDDRWITVVDPRAFVAPDVVVGRGCLVGPGACLSPGVRLADHVAVRHGGHVGHDTVVGTMSFIGANSVLCGWCRVGDDVHVAPNSSVKERLTVGDRSVIALGSVVLEDVAPGTTVAGTPARILEAS